MKKMIFIPAAAGVLAFGGLVLANTDTDTGQVPATPNNAEVNAVPAAKDNNGLIGFEKAAEIALEMADGKVTDIELGEDDGRREYEVEIRSAEYEYDFDIDAYTGEVLEQDRDRLDDDERTSSVKKGENVSGQSQKQKQDDTESLIPVEKAIEIALTKAGGGTVEDVELESDDGLRYYEIEIEDGRTEYEFKINATDGEVLKFEQDDDN